MLQTLRQNMEILQDGTPIYGMNQGTIGFLMNEYNDENLHERLEAAIPTIVHPLKMTAKTKTKTFEQIAINEVSLFRQTQQAAHISITVDGKVRLDELIADGILPSPQLAPFGQGAGAELCSNPMPKSRSQRLTLISGLFRHLPIIQIFGMFYR